MLSRDSSNIRITLPRRQVPLGFTKTLALVTASRGITVNAIAPGYSDTGMVAGVRPDVLSAIVKSLLAGRLARPEEIAWSILFLVGEEAGFIAGATLSINRGEYML